MIEQDNPTRRQYVVAAKVPGLRNVDLSLCRRRIVGFLLES